MHINVFHLSLSIFRTDLELDPWTINVTRNFITPRTFTFHSSLFSASVSECQIIVYLYKSFSHNWRHARAISEEKTEISSASSWIITQR